MSTKHEIIQGYADIIELAEELNTYGEQAWLTPLGEGKWTVKEVVGHILLWDKYIHDVITSAILNNTPLAELSVGADIESFNREAGEWALSKTKDEIFSALVASRRVVLEDLQAIPEESFTAIIKDAEGNPFVLKEFIVEMTRHDHHHWKQIESVL